MEDPEMKTCTRCGETYPLTKEYFPTSKGKFRYYCKPCGNEMSRNFKANNPEYISKYNKGYKIKHKDGTKIFNAVYYARRMKNDDSFAVRQFVSRRISKKYKEKHDLKYKESYLDLIGCTPEFFFKWIEFLDINGNFYRENYGEWHLDHVNPLNNYDLYDLKELKKCFHWSNYQPLNGIENIKKNSIVNTKLIKIHLKKACHFIIKYAKYWFKRNEYTLPFIKR